MLSLAAADFPFNDRDMLALMIPIIAICGGLLVGLISIIVKAIRNVAISKHVEESRREIAAYVAEGTMSPDDAYKLLEAGQKKKNSCWG